MSIVLVAVPAEQDPVWDISSEDVPHLTMLYLDDSLENLTRVRQFISHVAATSLSSFTLGVERRGVLGDESADVLFFSERSTSALADVRRYLLEDVDILKAFHATDQYPTWTPHLTLGYPHSPAKFSDSEDSNVPYAVTFDRLALWTGESEGAEFPLKPANDEVAMSAKGEAFFQHYGVKGMKWGVVRDAGKAAVKENYKPSQDAIDAKRAQTKAKLGGVRAMSNQEMRKVIARMELEQRYRDLYGERQYHDEAVSRAKRYSKKGARWAGRLITDILRDGGSSWIKRPGSNASGATSARARAWANGQQFGNVINGEVVTKAIGS